MPEAVPNEVVDQCGLSEANAVSTPMDSNVQLEKDNGYSKKVDAV